MGETEASGELLRCPAVAPGQARSGSRSLSILRNRPLKRDLRLTSFLTETVYLLDILRKISQKVLRSSMYSLLTRLHGDDI